MAASELEVETRVACLLVPGPGCLPRGDTWRVDLLCAVCMAVWFFIFHHQPATYRLTSRRGGPFRLRGTRGISHTVLSSSGSPWISRGGPFYYYPSYQAAS